MVLFAPEVSINGWYCCYNRHHYNTILVILPENIEPCLYGIICSISILLP